MAYGRRGQSASRKQLKVILGVTRSSAGVFKQRGWWSINWCFAGVMLKPLNCITCLRAQVHLIPQQQVFEFRAMSKIIGDEGEK